jgi:RNA exonuclease 1
LPCQQGPHVFRDSTNFQLHSRTAFVRTEEVTTPPPADMTGLGYTHPSIATKLEIVALDCELVYTTSGMSLARLTVVNSEGDVVLDEHVKPNGALLDTNYRFSGVKLEHLAAAKLDISGVRKKLGEIIDEKTVLVGHGLENDLKAMRLVHLNCIDTAIVRRSV